MGFKLDVKGLTTGLESLEHKAGFAAEGLVRTGATKMQGYAQKNAKWTDRTGAARGRLRAENSHNNRGFRITLSHGVDYGIWLELAHEKRFAIIEESLREVGEKQVMPAFQRLIERL